VNEPRNIIESDTPDARDERVEEMLEHTIDVSALAPEVSQQEPSDAADTLERLTSDDRSELIDLMEDEAAAQALSEMVEPLASMVIEELPAEDAAKYLTLMDPDDAADLLQNLDPVIAEAIYAALPRDEAEELRTLARYPSETAGGIMTTDYVAVRDTDTARKAIYALRDHEDLDEDTTSVFVIDEHHRLVGQLTLLQLVLAKRSSLIADVMEREVNAVRATLDREEVATEFDRHDYLVLPVIDNEGHLVGVVTVDDVIDIIREEATEDAQKMVGAAAGEAVYSGLFDKLKGRFPWLLVNLLTSFVAAVVVLRFSGLVEQLAILAVLMPVIANQAGNAGHQSLAVTLRGLVLGEVRDERVWPLLGRETALGFITGTIVGLLVAVVVTVTSLVMPTTQASWQLGLVVAFSMSGALTIGCLFGSGMPLLMHRLGADPATASTIFLTMLTDSVSFLAFLGLASLLQSWLPGIGPVT
jgi:magnesium transporter